VRIAYQEQIDDILADLARMCRVVSEAVQGSTTALLNADLHTAEQVISGDLELDRLQASIEERAFRVLARQSPVAGDLRTMVAVLRMVTELERMGDLAAHVANIARLRHPGIAVPTELRSSFARMGALAEAMVDLAGQTVSSRDVKAAEDVQTRDQEMDQLRLAQFRVLLDDDWPHGVEAAVDVALLGRYYERIADHAASIGRRIVYVVTGNLPPT
jgi:phosphate transport system protein